MSSFQLHWNTSTSLLIFVTNLAPDHIDWHGSYEAYVRAKTRIFAHQDDSGIAILQGRDIPELVVSIEKVRPPGSGGPARVTSLLAEILTTRTKGGLDSGQPGGVALLLDELSLLEA